MMKQTLSLLAAAIALPAFAYGTQPSSSENTLKDCLIQEVLPGKQMTGAFFTLEHKGSEETLTAAAIPSLSSHVEMHEMVMEGDVMKMSKIDSYTVKDGENKFQKGGYHLMVMNVEKAPELGSEHEITLTFKDGSTAACQAKVVSVEELIKNNLDAHAHSEHEHEHSKHEHEHDGHKHDSHEHSEHKH